MFSNLFPQDIFNTPFVDTLNRKNWFCPDTTAILTDSINWVKISGVYSALGNEKYAYLGSFFKNTTAPFIELPLQPDLGGIGYVYIDDLSIWEIGPTPVGVSESVANKAGVSVYPNPSNGEFTLAITNYNGSPMQLVVTDLAGRIVLKQPISRANTVIDGNKLAAGIYVCSLLNTTGAVVNYNKVSIQR